MLNPQVGGIDVNMLIMCINMKWVTNKYTGHDVLVKCGECLSCQYERSQSQRVLMDTHDRPDMIQFFLTLDYDNRFVPSVRLSEFGRGVDHHDAFPLSVYRGFSDDVLFELNVKKFKRYEKLPFLRKFPKKDGRPSIGVLFYKDFQDFAKRLRVNIQRSLSLDCPPNLSYFAVGEYGEDTSRPHFHSVFDVPRDIAPRFKSFVRQAWPFSLRAPYRQCELVYGDPSDYLSTYLSCNSDLPTFLQNKEIRQHSLHSIRYGYNNSDFFLLDVVDAFYRHSLRQPVDFKDCLNPLAVGFPYPKRFLCRYFPFIKGYSRLTVDSLERVFQKSGRLSLYARQLGYKWLDIEVGNFLRPQHDLTDNKSLIEHCWERCKPYMSRLEFAYISARIYGLLASHQMIDNYSAIVEPIDNFTAYDNLTLNNFDFTTPDKCPTLTELYYDLDCPRLLSPNRFPSRISKTAINAVRNVESRKIPKQNQAIRGRLGLNF